MDNLVMIIVRIVMMYRFRSRFTSLRPRMMILFRRGGGRALRKMTWIRHRWHAWYSVVRIMRVTSNARVTIHLLQRYHGIR